MPEKATVRRAKKDLKAGKSASTAAGEFVKREMDHIREGEHGARSTKQAIAIGLSEARRAGIKAGAPRRGTASPQTRELAKQDLATGTGRRKAKSPSPKRSRVAQSALKRESRTVASKKARSREAKNTANQRTRTRRLDAKKK